MQTGYPKGISFRLSFGSGSHFGNLHFETVPFEQAGQKGKPLFINPFFDNVSTGPVNLFDKMS